MLFSVSIDSGPWKFGETWEVCNFLVWFKEIWNLGSWLSRSWENYFALFWVCNTGLLLAKYLMMAYCCGISFHEKKNFHTSYSQVVKASRTLICVWQKSDWRCYFEIVLYLRQTLLWHILKKSLKWNISFYF